MHLLSASLVFEHHVFLHLFAVDEPTGNSPTVRRYVPESDSLETLPDVVPVEQKKIPIELHSIGNFHGH